MLDKDREIDPDYSGPIDLPDEHDSSLDSATDDTEPSLADDIADLIDDGTTYLQAELAFQKSRAGYVADRAKGVVVYGLGVFGLLHLALIAATVGTVIALVPHIGPWGATATVTLGLMVLCVVFALQVRKRLRQIAAVIAKKSE